MQVMLKHLHRRRLIQFNMRFPRKPVGNAKIPFIQKTHKFSNIPICLQKF